MYKILILMFLIISLNIFAQTTIKVPEDYATIQEGLNAANIGDTVLVEAGTYYENIIWPETNGINLIGQDSSNTIIDGGGVTTVIYINPQIIVIDTTTLIQNLKIANGGNVEKGGGIFLNKSHPKLDLLAITDNNTISYGAGMYLLESNPIMTNISFYRNISEYDGGGIYLRYSNPILKNVSFFKNSAGYYGGGGMYFRDSSPILTNVKIFQNSATGPGGRGGGTYIGPNSKPIFADVIIYENQATDGGGIYFDTCLPIIEGLSVLNNLAKKGGGIFVHWGKPIVKFSNIINNYSSEQGNGIYLDYGDIILDSCNINNSGYSIFNSDNTNYITATNNWFGDFSGPYHQTQNPTGFGDSTNQFVNVIPWLIEPNIIAPPIPILNLQVISTTDTEISLKWDNSLVGDLAGYKIHYSTDSTSWDFNNSVNVGLDTNFTLSNLQIGQTYYISATCFDTDGNESWYSETVTANTTLAPIISVNTNNIDYGNVTIKKETTFKIEIKNNGTAVLSVFNSQTTINEFYTNQLVEININPNETVLLPVHFKPLEVGKYNDKLTINSNANNNPQIEITLDGSGVLPEAPTILSITDVPYDQGGNVRIEFGKSRYDQNKDTTNSITSYTVWRLNTNSEWDAIGMFNADRSEKYNFVSTTLGDSTVNGIVWSVLKISAHSINPDVFYYSVPDSGYSIDNIAPSVPQGLNAHGFDDSIEIAWKSNKEKDFQYFAIYRSTDSEFNPDTMRTYTFSTIDSIYIDNDVSYGIEYFYKISAFDYAGNQSGYPETVSALVTDVGEENIIPQEYVLNQNYPNPFNPSTIIEYGLPEESNIKIEIFNMLGQRVSALVNGNKTAGYYKTKWNATNFPSGIYLISIKAEGISSKKNFSQTQKALLLK